MADTKPAAERDGEGPEERYDRELLELLNEVRVAMPGVQVLFGFLLAVPFQQNFQDTTSFQRAIYFVTLLCSAAATAFLVAPVAYHRIMFRRRDKPAIIASGNVSLIAGLFFLAVAMTGAVLLVTDVIFKASTAYATTIAVGLLFVVLWFAVGAVRRVSGAQSW
jgi:membrane-bound acyltransferase YfiQ involved in biofilm formation